ncbi:cytochrome o ubiquinol oxidase subunit III [Vitreoscilla massiliensis]|uniref:Cytochrome bo(3) ubiquinol oxidase subunit 3 n=1 Tax=Vitreoscilla massiliensis TaxID=1689272 RepID=A0ABY4E371_9NEIS|nr:cytochrome o ubiquinol oxidase subunit III [Vitreoscilla massiliensis]UOO90203.1 cytochrome o ubiquinol oxidase subunit III [Vitreoscilla massiliensis]
MTTVNVNDAHHHDEHHDHHEVVNANASLGFWIYIMTDLILFCSLFIGFQVLREHSAGGPTQYEVFKESLGFVFVETLVLLTSSFTFGMAHLAQAKRDIGKLQMWLFATFVLGAIFIGMEVYEFNHLIHNGQGPQVSAFLTSYFSLVGTHGLHVSSGLIWLAVIMVQIKKFGLTPVMMRRLTMLSIFWHFLDIVWVCVYTEVYLLGAIQ